MLPRSMLDYCFYPPRMGICGFLKVHIMSHPSSAEDTGFCRLQCLISETRGCLLVLFAMDAIRTREEYSMTRIFEIVHKLINVRE